ncbi:uncharacterized protein LOC118800902 [Colossoma macropomum]|uniref:uncharacterized protein LOC118800902 n=1 Tax=Colossoma macropomum TaxID=42526 RepID=UPI0018650C5A|nr:uncharacterized protein LOC118800902 [Colossoma macropomum]
MCSSTCTLPKNPTYIWYKSRQCVTNKLTRDKKLYLKCSEDAGNYSCAVRGHEELRSPEQTLSDYPEESSELNLVTVGVSVFLPLTLITAALWMCCVIWRKRGAQRDTDIQTPNPADHTCTALNPTTMTSDYDTLTHLTDSPSDTYTALNPETMSSDYNTLTHRTVSPSDTYTALNPATMCSDYDSLTVVKASHSEQHEALQRETPSADYENFQGPST